MTESRRLRTAFYEEIADFCAREAQNNLEFTSWLRSMDLELKLYRDATARGLKPTPFSKQVMDLHSLHGDLQDAAINVIFLIERRLILEPKFEIFRTAINVALHELREDNYKLFSALMTILPAEFPNGSRHPGHAPTDPQIDEILSKIGSQLNAAMNLSNWLSDFLVEAQNLLLGDMFDKRIAARKPLDQKQVVITLEAAEEIEAYFCGQTAWGHEKARIEQEIRTALGSAAAG